MTKLMMAALMASIALTPVVRAQSVEARKFGAREGVEQVSLSPDGKRVAIVVAMPGGSGDGLIVGNVDGQGGLKPIFRSSGRPDRLRYCGWSTPDRLVCMLTIIRGAPERLESMSRMIAVDADGSRLKELSAPTTIESLGAAYYGGSVLDWLPDDAGSSVLMDRWFVPEQSTGRLVAQRREGLGVERVDTVTLKRRIVEQPRGADAFMTDGHGEVRVMIQRPTLTSDYTSDKILSFYRKAGEHQWLELASATADSQTVKGFVPSAVDRDLNIAYGFDDDGKGHQALYSIALDGSMKRTMVFQRDGVDIDGLIRIGRQQRVVGVSFATEKRQVAFFDPKLKALSESLAKAIPGLPIIGFVDSSNDGSKLLLYAGSDIDPGRYFLLDQTTKKMAEVLPVRPELAGTKLATVKPITYAAADGTRIPGYLTLPPGSDGRGLPAIVMPHGGPSARDEWGFDFLAQFFASRGYAVLQPNFRGSSGFGEAWFRDNGFKSWKIAMSDVNDGARWLEAQGIAAPGKLAIFGWSYGGYAALQSSVLDPNVFKAIVAVAPVTDLEVLRKESEFHSDFKLVSAFIGQGPHVREGSPAQNADRITAPVLLFHGDKDMNVGVGESRLMQSRLKAAGKQVDYVEFEGLDHQLDDDRARVEMLDKSDRFIRKTLGLPDKP
ncbi:alpha/beta hydrolase family protein [Sphingomonas sp. RS6]